MHNSRILIWLAALTLAACGGSDSSSFATVATPGGTTAAASATSVLLVSDVSTIPSDNSSNATITAYVRDASNQFLANIPVAVTASSGALTPIVTGTASAGVTDANGAVKYSLSTLGDKTNRTITVTAKAGTITSTATVNVVGSTLKVQGAPSLTVGQSQAFTVTLNDFGAKGIAGAAVTVTPPANASVSATSLTTDATGHATFNVTGQSGGTGTVTVTSQGLTATADVVVASDSLIFTGTTPAANALIALQTASLFTAAWSSNGTPVSGQTISFATTRGCLSATPVASCSGLPSILGAVTSPQGQASVYALSTNAGGATVTATLPTNGTQVSRLVNFVATTPASIDVQPSIFTLAPGDTSTITAIVRDAQNNLVAGQTVSFTVTDVTGGTLSIASATTDLQGRAQTVYTAGSVASANNGVHITATVAGISSTVDLTVARRQVFISIGTGNEISEPNTAQYKKDYVVQVTDVAGVGVKGVSLSMSILSQNYFKGIRKIAGTGWATCYTIPQAVGACLFGTPPDAAVTLGCPDEDANHNGILDPGENQNGLRPDGTATLEAGNIAAALPATVVTDNNGFALVSVYYPQEYAYYLQVTLKAVAQVQGTAFSASSTFLLEGLSTDFSNVQVSPPGPISPFGKSNTCSDLL